MRAVKVLILLILVSTHSQSLIAQVSIGALGGVNWATQSGEGNLGRKKMVGLGVGGILNIALTQRYSLQFEPMFIQKGTKDIFRSRNGQFIASINTRTKYIEVPATLKASFDYGFLKPYFSAGPSLAFFFEGDTDVESTETGPEIDVINLGSAARTVDFGLTFGIGVSFIAAKNTVFLEAKYSHGLTDIYTFESSTRKTRDFRLFTGFLISLN